MLDVSSERSQQTSNVRVTTSWQQRARVSIIGCGLSSASACSAQEVLNLLLACGPPHTAAHRRVLPSAQLAALAALGPRDLKKMDRFSLLALGAAKMALKEGGLNAEETRRCGIITGNMVAGWTFTEPQLRSLHTSGMATVSPYLATAWFPAAPQGQVTIHLSMQGYAKTLTTDRCAGAQAIGMAFERIKNGQCELLLAGGVEAPVTPFVEAAFAQAGGNPDSLVEAASYFLLTARESDGPAIGAHSTFPLGPLASFQCTRLGEKLTEIFNEIPEHQTPDTIVCNVAPDWRVEDEVVSLIRKTLATSHVRLIFPARALGDSLAASGPVAAAVAYALLMRKEDSRSVVVLTVGHQCGDLLWMYI